MNEGSAEQQPRRAGLEHPRVAILLIGLLLIGSGGWIGLIEPAETRYAEVAREMLVSGDWLTPRLDGIHHFHKPPLAYWAAAAGMAAMGVNEWGARLMALLANLATIALAAWIAARRFAALAIEPGKSAWVLGSMLLFAIIGRGLATDPFLAATVALYWALAPSTLALAALGLGFMTKGPVVFVHTLLPVLVAALWARDRRFLALLGPPRGWIVFSLIALPWYLAMVFMNPGLLGYFVGNQVVARLATEAHGHGGPPYYFVIVLLAGTAPWTMAMLVGIARTWRERMDPEARLLLAWLLAPLIFFSFSGSKLPSYLLPCIPAAALLAARGLDSGLARWGAMVTLGGLALYGGFELFEAGFSRGPMAALAIGALVAWLLGAVAAAWGRMILAALSSTLALAALGIALAPFDSELGSPRRITALLTEHRRGEPVVEIAHFISALPFYLRERVWLLEVAREKHFDRPGTVPAVIATRDSLRLWADRYGRVWTFGPERPTREIATATGLEFVSIATWRKETLGFMTPAP